MNFILDNGSLIITGIENNDKKLLEIKQSIIDKEPEKIIFNLDQFLNIDSSKVAAFLAVIKFNQDSKSKSEIIFLNPTRSIEAKLSYVGLLDFGVVKRGKLT